MKCQQWFCGSFQGQLSCVCIFWVLLFGILSHSPLVLCEVNQGKSVWVVHFVMCLRGSVCTGHTSGSALCARGGSLFSSCSVCLSHCVHPSFILLFIALLNPTLPLAGSPGCASSFLGSWRSSVLPLPYSLSAFFHGPFPSSRSPCYVLPMRGTQCALKFSSVMGKESFDALTITAMAGKTVKLWEWAQYFHSFPLCLIPQ